MQQLILPHVHNNTISRLNVTYLHISVFSSEVKSVKAFGLAKIGLALALHSHYLFVYEVVIDWFLLLT